MERYHRQLMLPEIGHEGQARLTRASCFVVGAGGLGSPILQYLVAAGIGHIAIADEDKVGLTNLNRQTLYAEADIDKEKATCAAEHLRALNSEVEIIPITKRITRNNATTLLQGYDIVVDGSDNIATRYALDDATRELGIPYIYGAIDGFEGQVAIFNYGTNPRHLRDIWPEENATDNSSTQAAIGTTAAIVGAVEAHEAIKIICGYGTPLAARLWRIDTRTMDCATIEL